MAGAIALATTGASGWLIFWLYFIHPRLGHASAFLLSVLSLVTLVSQIFKIGKDGRAVVASVLPPAALSLSAALLVLSTGLMYGGTQDPIETAKVRFSHPLPADDYLPFLFAEELRDGKILNPFFISWHSSDRPPLQTGIVLTEYPFLRQPRRLGYTVVGVLAQSLWIFGLWLLLRTLGIGRRAITVVLVTCFLSGFIFVNSFFVWPKLLAAAYMLAFMACLVLQWRRRGSEESRSALVLQTIVAAVLLAFSMLSHGGSVFAVIGLAVAVLPFAQRLPVRRLGKTLAIAFAVYLPWIGYQKLADPPGNTLLKMHLARIEPPDSRRFAAVLVEAYTKVAFRQIVSNKLANVERAFGHEADFWINLQVLISDLTGGDGKLRAHLPEIGNAMRIGAFFHFAECLGLLMLGPLLLFAGLSGRFRSVEWCAATLLWVVALAIMVPWCLIMYGPGTTILHQGSYVPVLLAFAGSVLAAWAVSRWFAYSLCAVQITLNIVLYGCLMNVNAGPEPLSEGYVRPAIAVLASIGAAAVAWCFVWLERTHSSGYLNGGGHVAAQRITDAEAAHSLAVRMIIALRSAHQ